jgi:hypothetical protein
VKKAKFSLHHRPPSRTLLLRHPHRSPNRFAPIGGAGAAAQLPACCNTCLLYTTTFFERTGNVCVRHGPPGSECVADRFPLAPLPQPLPPFVAFCDTIAGARGLRVRPWCPHGNRLFVLGPEQTILSCLSRWPRGDKPDHGICHGDSTRVRRVDIEQTFVRTECGCAMPSVASASVYREI